MDLRQRAAEMVEAKRADRTKIGQLIAANPDDADAIVDLLTGAPHIPHALVAETLNDVFTASGGLITQGDVAYWRKVRPS